MKVVLRSLQKQLPSQQNVTSHMPFSGHTVVPWNGINISIIDIYVNDKNVIVSWDLTPCSLVDRNQTSPRDSLQDRNSCTLDRLCGLVVRVLGYRSGGPDSIPGTTRKKK
jgi:hypothetical protein